VSKAPAEGRTKGLPTPSGRRQGADGW